MWWCRNCLLIEQIQQTSRTKSTCGIICHRRRFQHRISSTSGLAIDYHCTSTMTLSSVDPLGQNIPILARNYSGLSNSKNRCSASSSAKRLNWRNCSRGSCLLLPNIYTTKTFISLPGTPTKKKEFVERRLIGYSMEQMFDVVSDVENYKHFLPWCASSVVKSRSPSQIVADLVIGMSPVTESYTSVVTLKKPFQIRAQSKEGRHFKEMNTNWKFSPGLKGIPQSCLIDFYVSFEFRSAFHSQIANIFFNEVVKAMTNAFFVEAKKRNGPESIPSRRVALIPAGKPSLAKSKSDDDNLP